MAKTAKITNLGTLTYKINDLDQKIEPIYQPSGPAGVKYNEKIKKIEQVVSKSANENDLDEAYKRLYYLEELVRERKAQAIMQESFKKRFNILLHGFKESDKSAWETRDETLKIIQNFLREGLKVMQPAEIALTYFHRLPQQPVLKNGKKVNRPIVIKVTNSSDKHFIFSSLKNLKPNNSKRKLQSLQPHYITEHLPKPSQEENYCFPNIKQQGSERKRLCGELKKGTIIYTLTMPKLNCHYIICLLFTHCSIV